MTKATSEWTIAVIPAKAGIQHFYEMDSCFRRNDKRIVPTVPKVPNSPYSPSGEYENAIAVARCARRSVFASRCSATLGYRVYHGIVLAFSTYGIFIYGAAQTVRLRAPVAPPSVRTLGV